MPLFLLLTACWRPGEEYTSAVFSDDGERVAAVYMEFDARETITHQVQRDQNSQVLVAEDAQGTSPEILTEPANGFVEELFFMGTEGYLLLGRATEEEELRDGSAQNDIAYDLVSLDGTVTTLAEGNYVTHISCGGVLSWGGDTVSPLRIIPSPDGSVLALFEAETTCEQRAMQLSFLDASDGAVLDGPFALEDLEPEPMSGGQVFARVALAWTEDDAFAVGLGEDGVDGETLEATLYRPGEEAETGVSMSDDCFHPPTTSSDTSAEGQVIVIDEETGEMFVDSEESGRVFGCES